MATTSTQSTTDGDTKIDWDKVTEQSDLTRPGRHVHIVTTAALPWFTGTAVNPLLRAAYLFRRLRKINNDDKSWVTLVIPFLELDEDQEAVYNQVLTQKEQEEYIRDWLTKADMEDVAKGLDIVFYPSRYHDGLGSIFAMGDIIKLLDTNKRDVCILEEPEHCNWYRAPSESWTSQFEYVIGIIHTNYIEYAKAQPVTGLFQAPALSLLSSAMVRAHCDCVIKLSDALQTYAPEKETVKNLHGVRSCFLEEGKKRQEHGWEKQETNEDTAHVYFVGKLLWAKGLDLMLELEDSYKEYTGDYFKVDVYGNGPEQEEIKRAYLGRKQFHELQEKAKESNVGSDNDSNNKVTPSDAKAKEEQMASNTNVPEEDKQATGIAKLHEKAKIGLRKVKGSIPQSLAELRKEPVPATFPGRRDHAELTDYKVFLNPSISEVLCTTTAEALAMGKFVIIPVHPSNNFFLRFPNCLAYRNKFEAVANLKWALSHDPDPLSAEHLQELTWEAATDRLLAAAAITKQQEKERKELGKEKLDERIAWFHNEIGKGTKGDALRALFGGGPVSRQAKYERDSSNDDTKKKEEGWMEKFRRSSITEALQKTVQDLQTKKK